MPRKILALLLVCLLLPWGCLAESAAVGSGGALAITVPISSPVRKTPLTWEFPYSDALFDAPATTYSHTLAQSSLGLAIAAFRQKGATLPEKDRAVRQYLLDAGFGTLKSEQFDVTPTVDTIATMIGSKQVGGATLLAVAVSGGDYQKEWESNFTISISQYEYDEVFHEGFAAAATEVCVRIMMYLHEQEITGPVKIWLTGYSRAAAVSNLTAYALLDGGVVRDEDMYAYTFATPRCMANAAVPACPSVFNIVGSFDPVTAVPFKEWGYDRYGNTLYLPAQELCEDYARRKAAVEPVYKQLTGLSYWNNPQSNWLCCKVMQTLDEMMRSVNEYKDTLQGVILGAMNLAGGMWSRISAIYQMISGDKTITQMLADVWFSTSDLYSTVVYSLFRQWLGLEENQWNHGTSFKVELIHEHCPDVYIGWMFSQNDPKDLYITDIDYHQLTVAGDVDVVITDDTGVPLASPVSFALGDTQLYTFPADKPRTVTLTARGDTRVNVMGIGRRAQSLNARILVWATETGEHLPLKSNETLVLGFPKGIAADSAAYTSSAALLTLAADTQTLDIVDAFAEMDTVDSGESAHGFLRVLLWCAAAALALLIALIILVIVRIVRRGRRGKRRSRRRGKQSALEDAGRDALAPTPAPAPADKKTDAAASQQPPV